MINLFAILRVFLAGLGNLTVCFVRKMFRISFSLLCIKYILFWYYRSARHEGDIKHTKTRYYVSHEMRGSCTIHVHGGAKRPKKGHLD